MVLRRLVCRGCGRSLSLLESPTDLCESSEGSIVRRRPLENVPRYESTKRASLPWSGLQVKTLLVKTRRRTERLLERRRRDRGDDDDDDEACADVDEVVSEERSAKSSSLVHEEEEEEEEEEEDPSSDSSSSVESSDDSSIEWLPAIALASSTTGASIRLQHGGAAFGTSLDRGSQRVCDQSRAAFKCRLPLAFESGRDESRTRGRWRVFHTVDARPAASRLNSLSPKSESGLFET